MDEIPATVGTAVAVSVTAPRVDGRQVQVATILGDDPEVNLFLHPGIITFRARNVIIPGCKNLSASANVAKSCSYKPNTRGYVRISVALVPTDAGFSNYSAMSAT